jgi:hypothetical protein
MRSVGCRPMALNFTQRCLANIASDTAERHASVRVRRSSRTFFFAATQTAKKSSDAVSRGIARSIDVTDGRTHAQQASFVFPRENDNTFLIVLERITLEQLHNPGPVPGQGLLFKKACCSERACLFRKACSSRG